MLPGTINSDYKICSNSPNVCYQSNINTAYIQLLITLTIDVSQNINEILKVVY